MSATTVRTAPDDEGCTCVNPWEAHPDGFVWARGNPYKHLPQTKAGEDR